MVEQTGTQFQSAGVRENMEQYLPQRAELTAFQFYMAAYVDEQLLMVCEERHG